VDEERWPYTPTGRSQRLKLLEEMAELCPNTPPKKRIVALDHYMEQTDTQLHIIRDELTKYETYKRDKTTNRRLMAQGRIFGAPEAQRLREQEDLREQERVAREQRQAYGGGIWQPEYNIAKREQALHYPGEAGQLWAGNSHVFWTNQQPARPHKMDGWDGRSARHGGGSRRRLAPRAADDSTQYVFQLVEY
jgi:hypothetical protein